MNSKISNLLDQLEAKEKEVITIKKQIFHETVLDVLDQINSFYSGILTDDSSELMTELKKSKENLVSMYNKISENLGYSSNVLWEDENNLRDVKNGLRVIKKAWRNYTYDKNLENLLRGLKEFNRPKGDRDFDGYNSRKLKSLALNVGDEDLDSIAGKEELKCCCSNSRC